MARMVDGMERLVRGEAPPPPVATLLGIRLMSFGAGRRSSRSTPGPRTRTRWGPCRAASWRRWPDGAMGWAYMTTLGEGESYTTLEVKVNFLRPVRAGTLEARARVKSAGRTIGLVECDVLGPDGKLLAHGVGTCMVLRGEQAAGR
jgi:uncharacterized protein (TIGR00369 family)